jgi:hypothetical protein
MEEHQEIPKEEAAVMPVGEPRKRRRVCNLSAEHHQKRKERTWGNRRLQEGVPPYKSGMAKKEPLQECSDPNELWITEESDRHQHKDDPLCRSGTAQGTQS